MVKLIQPSMAGGEVSPAVGSRVDLAKRAVAVEAAVNFFSTFTGALRSRPGQRFVARCKPGSTDYRLIEFEFNTDQTFVLELGNEYMRFHTNGAQILDSSAEKTITGATQANPVVVTSTAHGLSNGDEVYIDGVVGMTELNGRNFLIANVTANTFELQTLNGDDVDGTGYTAYSSGGTATPPYELSAPWAAADLEDIGYAQSGDIMTLCHPSYAPRELKRISNDSWTLTAIAFVPEQDPPTNLAGTANVTGSRPRAYAVTAVNRDTGEESLPALSGTSVNIMAITKTNPAVVLCEAAHGLASFDTIRIQGVSGLTELNDEWYQVVVKTTDELELRQANGLEVDATGLGSTQPSATITGITNGSICTVTAAGHGFSDGDIVLIDGVAGMTEVNGNYYRVRDATTDTFELADYGGTNINSSGFGTYTSGGTATLQEGGGGTLTPNFIVVSNSKDAEWDNSISWDEIEGADYYNVYASDAFQSFGFIGTTSNLKFNDVNKGPDFSVSPPRLFNPFNDIIDPTDKHPSTVGFFQQRRILANSNDFPNRFWMSRIGAFNNISSAVPVKDDDAIVATIAARRINEIRHILPISDLAFLTSGGEYRAYGEGGAITPKTLNVKPQSYYGSTKVRPIVAGEVGLFITPGQFVRDFKYQFADDKFVGKDISILARHLFDYNEIRYWDFAPAPYGLGFAIRDDGVGLFLTYQPEQEVYAWTRAVTQGDYKSVCVVREGQNDVIYIAVDRTIDGNDVTFIERLDPHKFEELEDAFCVDAGLTLDNPITITGMTAADPVVVTAPGHGLSNGDTVDIAGVYEVSTDGTKQGKTLSEDYNGTGFTIANVTADTFELQNAGSDYDGSDFAAYSSGGEVRQAVTTVSGLWHLEGATVVAAANGYAERDLTVENGQVTLGAAASRVHVGLPYTCRMVTLPLETYGDSAQTSRGITKNITRLTVEVERTMGMWYGPTVDQMREAKFGLPSKWGQPLSMITDQINVTLKPDWGKKKQVVLEQRDPLPLTILSLVPDMQGGGN